MDRIGGRVRRMRSSIRSWPATGLVTIVRSGATATAQRAAHRIRSLHVSRSVGEQVDDPVRVERARRVGSDSSPVAMTAIRSRPANVVCQRLSSAKTSKHDPHPGLPKTSMSGRPGSSSEPSVIIDPEASLKTKSGAGSPADGVAVLGSASSRVPPLRSEYRRLNRLQGSGSRALPAKRHSESRANHPRLVRVRRWQQALQRQSAQRSGRASRRRSGPTGPQNTHNPVAAPGAGHSKSPRGRR